MGKLSMCRICVTENVRMHVVTDGNLHDVYEKLTDIPFLSGDIRPMVACYLCYFKLKQCYHLLRQCMQAEEVFTCMLSEDQKEKVQRPQSEFTRFVTTLIEHINIHGDERTDNDTVKVKEEVPDIYEEDDIAEKTKETSCDDEIEYEHISTRYTEQGLTPLQYKYDVPLVIIKTEVLEESSNNIPEPDVTSMRTNEEYEDGNSSSQEMLIPHYYEYEVTLTKNVDEILPKQKRKAKGTRSSITKKVKQASTVAEIQTDRRAHYSTALTAPFTPHEHIDTRENHKDTTINNSYNDENHKSTEFKYKCHICQRKFEKKHNLYYHKLSHNEKPYKCQICHRSFTAKSHFDIHSRVHTGEKPYKCVKCKHSFNVKGNLDAHMRLHNGEKPYKCDVCQLCFKKESYLSSHLLTHTDEKPFKCDICGHNFRHKSNLNSHLRIHTGEKPYKCDKCMHSFNVKNHFQTHMLKHTGEKPYKCDICEFSFSDKRSLSRHAILAHNSAKPFKCDICEQSFKQKCYLLSHMRKHSSEEPYSCDICGRKFKHKSNMNAHRRRHTGDKPYDCEVCERKFSQKSSLNVHLRRHNDENPYNCELCVVSFRDLRSLQNHFEEHMKNVII